MSLYTVYVMTPFCLADVIGTSRIAVFLYIKSLEKFGKADKIFLSIILSNPLYKCLEELFILTASKIYLSS